MPTAGVQKTLHQRNKSSPSLSTINAGGLKTAAKRTAFGDVSNTANVLRPSKDDSVIHTKGEYNPLEKAIPPQQEKKPTALLRPAQRPPSVSALKSILNSVPGYTAQPTFKQTSVEVQQPSQPPNPVANTRKIVTKKSTAIFKDSALTQPATSVPTLQNIHTSVAPVAPVHRELPARQQLQEPDAYQDQQPRLTRKQSKHMPQQETQEQSTAPSTTQTSSEEPPVRSDGIYTDENGQVQLYDYVDPIELADVQFIETASELDGEIPKTIGRPKSEQTSDLRYHPEAVKKPTLPPVSEPEEYWDDEGEENYDEEGYVTARSIKSRGDNTTGGATTVLFPKVTQKAKKEIAAAKDLIEGSKTVEELEDDVLDTTMVAEYGEEIFQYMKDLEV